MDRMAADTVTGAFLMQVNRQRQEAASIPSAA
jgi:hypothetical protein